eukprot:CAMPEP_0114153650 /NCGR_PEP_ID=MMETSP0043_2-20121206/24478_1 /TAXON_ID=464988 /ORGANISM="Hemiselmis andersenii, Strain CCMP644" /LENGTH=48 /DNA_ID= /DNA_START= /DNA_END= /DNA_ORIENTATION=
MKQDDSGTEAGLQTVPFWDVGGGNCRDHEKASQRLPMSLAEGEMPLLP